MPDNDADFEIDDTRSFDENLAAFTDALTALDPALAARFAGQLGALLTGKISRTELWTVLAQSLEADVRS